jgi:beta-N-acetylhexosaminidase
VRTNSSPPVGQLIILGFDGIEMSPGISSLLQRIQPAGVILFARNIVTAQQTHKLLQDCQACVPTPLFTCVDMEGGTVDRFRKITGPAPSAADVYATGDQRRFRKHGTVIGECCRALGFNTDFAPVIDLAFSASRTVMSSRAVSADPKEVVVYASEFLSGLRSAGVLGAIKHFPGLGEANLDTHHDLPTVDKPLKKLWEQDIAPYRALRRDAPMVLVGHAAYPAVTKDCVPASLSKKWITDVLRRRIGYRGLVVSDDLEMGGVLKAASMGRAAVEHIRAGGDLCLVCHIAEHIEQAFEALMDEAERDRKFARRCLESLERVRRFKARSKELTRRTSSPSPQRVQKLSRQLLEFGEQVRLESIKQQDEA